MKKWSHVLFLEILTQVEIQRNHWILFFSGPLNLTNRIVLIREYTKAVVSHFNIRRYDFSMVGNNYIIVVNDFSMVVNDYIVVGNNFSMVGNNYIMIVNGFIIVVNDYCMVVNDFLWSTMILACGSAILSSGWAILSSGWINPQTKKATYQMIHRFIVELFTFRI